MTTLSLYGDFEVEAFRRLRIRVKCGITIFSLDFDSSFNETYLWEVEFNIAIVTVKICFADTNLWLKVHDVAFLSFFSSDWMIFIFIIGIEVSDSSICTYLSTKVTKLKVYMKTFYLFKRNDKVEKNISTLGTVHESCRDVNMFILTIERGVWW